MKKNLLFTFFLLFISFASFVYGQGATCTVNRVGIQITNSVANGAGCTVTANLFFVAQERNNGQKFFNVHLWQQGSRPTGLNFSNPLPQSALNAALRNLVIEDFGTGNTRDWRLSRLYNRVNNNPAVNISGVTLFTFRVREDQPIPPGLENFVGYTFFVLSNVVFNTTTPCGNLNLVADVTGAQGNFNQNIQCFNTGLEVFNCQVPQGGFQPQAFGDIQCTSPASFTFGFSNAGGCLPYYITYSIYADVNNNGTVDAGEPLVSDGPAGDNAVLFPGETVVRAPRPLTGPAANANLIVTNITTNTVNNTGTGVFTETLDDVLITNGCIVLPVRFKSFHANRNKLNRHQVELTWETALEQNNKGFHVQRKVNGNWETVAFVPSAASGGNSSEPLNYRFADNNTFRGVSQYRLLQEDNDGSMSYSEVKSVRGAELNSGLVIYPNPATSGRVNVLFAEGTSTRDVWVNDVSGRTIKQYRGVADNTLAIDGLAEGFYTIRVVDRKTNAVQITKVVVH